MSKMKQKGIYSSLFVIEHYLQIRIRKYLDPLGLDSTGYQFLAFISSHGGCRVHDLVETLRTERAFAHRKLNMLGLRGYIQKKPCKTDCRSFTLFATSAGQAIVSEVESILEQWEEEMRSLLGEEDFSSLQRVIDKLASSSANDSFDYPVAIHEGLHFF